MFDIYTLNLVSGVNKIEVLIGLRLEMLEVMGIIIDKWNISIKYSSCTESPIRETNSEETETIFYKIIIQSDTYFIEHNLKTPKSIQNAFLNKNSSKDGSTE